MDQRISLINRIKLKLNGSVYLGNKENDNLPYYMFECSKHGLVESYPQGYPRRLECPLCRLERYAHKYPDPEKVRKLIEKL